jgi:hypothetical protein
MHYAEHASADALFADPALRLYRPDAGLAPESAEHILCWRDGETLRARIEGTVKGKERSEEWRLTPAK